MTRRTDENKESPSKKDGGGFARGPPRKEDAGSSGGFSRGDFKTRGKKDEE